MSCVSYVRVVSVSMSVGVCGMYVCVVSVSMSVGVCMSVTAYVYATYWLISSFRR